MSERPRFHLAFPVRDLSEARAFYGDLLGCPEGRSSDDWVDFDFFGHQIVAHLSPKESGHKAHNDVDGDQVPVRHFGTILSMNEWKKLAARLLAYISQGHPRYPPGRRTVHHRKVLTQFTSRGGVSGARCRDTADTCRCPRNWCTGRHYWSLCTWCTGPIRHTRRTSLFVHSFHRLPMNQAGREGRDAHRDVFGTARFR